MKIKNILLSTAAAATSLFAIGATASAATYTVKAGDTVSQIALDHQTTISAIQQANHLQDVNLILVGQQLELNGTAATTSSATTSAQPQTHVQATTQQAQPTQRATTAQTPTTSQTTTQSQTQTHSTTATAPVQHQSTTATNVSGSDSAAKAWIAGKESGGSYTAQNGQYIGKYQLTASYLNGDYSAANQEKVADQYVANRYGSWSNAKSHWVANGWY